jgi:hypothetical protein
MVVIPLCISLEMNTFLIVWKGRAHELHKFFGYIENILLSGKQYLLLNEAIGVAAGYKNRILIGAIFEKFFLDCTIREPRKIKLAWFPWALSM